MVSKTKGVGKRVGKTIELSPISGESGIFNFKSSGSGK